MPTYRSLGMTASLKTCDLRSCLSETIVLTMGTGQQREARRINDVLTNGMRLPERPFGADGTTKGVMQFIGSRGDMALFVAEAGEGILDYASAQDSKQSQPEAAYLSSLDRMVLEMSDDSPLTSLADTPSSQSIAVMPTTERMGFSVNPPSPDKLAARLAKLGEREEQALVLEIQLSRSTFLPPPSSRGTSIIGCKDLKIDVFLNGELVDVQFISCRKAAMQTQPLLLSGTRVHRQVEKPWVYVPSRASNKDGTGNQWQAICSALSREARLRGRNQYNETPPSAAFLTALAEHDAPDRIKDREGLGVIDIVVTAGTGRKYDASHEYIPCPTRMDDPLYAIADSFTSASSVTGNRSSRADSVLNLSFESYMQQSSPEVPLQHTRKPPLFSVSPPKRSVQELAKEIGINGDLNKVRFDSWEKTSGQYSRGPRTLKQRLGDICKMSPRNMAKEVEALKAELRLDEKSSKETEEIVESTEVEKDPGRVNKRMKLAHPVDHGAGPAQDDPFVDLLPGDGTTMSPADMHKVWPTVCIPPPAPMIDPMLHAHTDPEALLAQSRIDMALDAGLASNGPLIRRIASTSPLMTPRKITKASSLAHSPTTTPVKPQTRSRREVGSPTPKRERSVLLRTRRSPLSNALAPDPTAVCAALTATPMQPNHTASTARMRSAKGRKTPSPSKRDATPTPLRSGRGANRTTKKWDPTEPDHEAVLRSFKVPENCVGSCVTYASDAKAQRQIKKERAGAFVEEHLVVGMRFLVV